MEFNSIFSTDSYKCAHPAMMPEGVEMMYGNATPRSGKHAPEGVDFVIADGQQLVIQYLHEHFKKHFFDNPNAVKEIEEELSLHYGSPYDATHFQKLHDLGYLPLAFKALPEGVKVPFGVPVMTWYNTHKDFAWLSLFIETPLSAMYWTIPTSSTIAYLYQEHLYQNAMETDPANIGFVKFQGHDFAARGQRGLEAAWLSGVGHAFNFWGSDTLSVIPIMRHFYDATGFIIGSVPASEHSVSSANIAVRGEKDMIQYYMKKFPKGLLSIVSDTLDYWKVLTEYIPELKPQIMSREGKIVIRPDSGDPVRIICGYDIHKVSEEYFNDLFAAHYSELKEGIRFDMKDVVITDGRRYNIVNRFDFVQSGKYWTDFTPSTEHEAKGSIQVLWELFGGHTNEQGFNVLDEHIGLIYGDAITLPRMKKICQLLKGKGFATTNVVLGIGSYTYQYVTRDTFGWAMKATAMEVDINFLHDVKDRVGVQDNPYNSNTVLIDIYKDPATDDGKKKSAKGLLKVYKEDGVYKLQDQCTLNEETTGELRPIYENGTWLYRTTLDEVRSNIDQLIQSGVTV